MNLARPQDLPRDFQDALDDACQLGGAAPVALAAIREAYESWLPTYMSRTLGANP